MAHVTTVASANAEISRAKQTLLNDIGQMWNMFTSKGLSQLKDSDDLVRQVVSMYGIDKAAAEKDVERVMKGRSLAMA